MSSPTKKAYHISAALGPDSSIMQAVQERKVAKGRPAKERSAQGRAAVLLDEERGEMEAKKLPYYATAVERAAERSLKSGRRGVYAVKSYNVDHRTLLPKKKPPPKAKGRQPKGDHSPESKQSHGESSRARRPNLDAGSRGVLDGSTFMDAEDALADDDAPPPGDLSMLRSTSDEGAEAALRATRGSVASVGVRGGASSMKMQPMGGSPSAAPAASAPAIGLAGAGGARGMDISSFTKRNVRALARQEAQSTGADPEAEAGADALLQGLETNVRYALLRKRAEYDAEKQKTTKLKAERDKLRLRFRDLQADLKALGVGQAGRSAKQPRAKRMQPFKSVSGKPMYVERSDLSKLEANLEAEKKATSDAIYTGEMLQFMRRRLMDEIVAVKSRLGDLEVARKEEKALEDELRRRGVQANEALGNARSRLRGLQRDVKKEKGLWFSEIKDKAAFLEQKKGFESFLQKQIQHHVDLERKARIAKQRQQKQKEIGQNVASMLASRAKQSRLTQQRAGAEDEEAKYAAIFSSIGLKTAKQGSMAGSSTSEVKAPKLPPAIPPPSGMPSLSSGDTNAPSKATLSTLAPGAKHGQRTDFKVSLEGEPIDPTAVLDAMHQQDENRQLLLKKREAEESRLAQLQARLAEAKKVLANARAESQPKSAHRALADSEGKLQLAHKEIQSRQARLEFLRSASEPVRIGLQAMGERLLNMRTDIGHPEEARLLLSALLNKVKLIMDETKRMQATSDPEEWDEGPSPANASVAAALTMRSLQGGGDEGGDVNQQNLIWNAELKAADGLFVSKFNVRVPPSTTQPKVLYSAEYGMDDQEEEGRIAKALEMAETVGQRQRASALAPLGDGKKQGGGPGLPLPGSKGSQIKPSAQSRKARERGKKVAATAAAVKAATAKARTGVSAPLEPLPAVSDADDGIPHVKGKGPSHLAPILQGTIAGPGADMSNGTFKPRRAGSAQGRRGASEKRRAAEEMRLSYSAAALPMPLHPVSRYLRRPPALVSAFESPSVHYDTDMAEGRAQSLAASTAGQFGMGAERSSRHAAVRTTASPPSRASNSRQGTGRQSSGRVGTGSGFRPGATGGSTGQDQDSLPPPRIAQLGSDLEADSMLAEAAATALAGSGNEAKDVAVGHGTTLRVVPVASSQLAPAAVAEMRAQHELDRISRKQARAAALSAITHGARPPLLFDPDEDPEQTAKYRGGLDESDSSDDEADQDDDDAEVFNRDEIKKISETVVTKAKAAAKRQAELDAAEEM